MKKDYIAVRSEEHGISEAEFVNRHWTKAWETARLGRELVDEVVGRDEFRELSKLLRRVPEGGRILDGGSGRGEWTILLNDLGYEALGLDISAVTVERLCSRFGDALFRAGDIRDTGLDEDSFDAVISWGTFEHFEEGLQGCFRESMRILKEGGLLAVTVPFYNERHQRADNRAPAADHVYVEDMRFYQWRLTADELRQEFVKAGFRVEVVKPIHKKEGVARMLCAKLGVATGTAASDILSRLLSPMFSGDKIAHMLFAAGWKPSS